MGNHQPKEGGFSNPPVKTGGQECPPSVVLLRKVSFHESSGVPKGHEQLL